MIIKLLCLKVCVFMWCVGCFYGDLYKPVTSVVASIKVDELISCMKFIKK